jgi:hypothetical protein
MNISSILLILLTFSMCGALFFSIGLGFGSIYDLSSSSPAKIEVVQFSGGDRYNDTIRFQDNVLILNHAGGSPLPLDLVSIQINGSGNSYLGIPGSGGMMIYGDISVFYEHIGADQKNKDFEKNNKEMLKDGYWSAGEKLILTGNDSENASSSSVFVTVGNNGSLSGNTSNNYGFSSETKAEVLVFQKNSKNLKQILLKKDISVSKNE